MGFNQYTVEGHLTRDIELRYSPNGVAISNTGVAVSKKFTQNGEKKEKTMFMDVTFFNKMAETANQFLRKGSHVLLSGEIDFQQWEDQNGGGKRSKHVLNANIMQMLDKKGDGGARNASQNEQADRYSNNGSSGQNQQQAQSYQAPQQQQQQQQSYQQPAQNQQNQQPQQQQQQQAPLPMNDIPSIDIDEDEIPF